MSSLSNYDAFNDHKERYSAAGEKVECTFCGDKRPTGFWNASPADVYVCQSCALHTLPKLIADACWDECIDMHKMSYYTGTILKNYWKAMAINFARKRAVKTELPTSDPVMDLFNDQPS